MFPEAELSSTNFISPPGHLYLRLVYNEHTRTCGCSPAVTRGLQLSAVVHGLRETKLTDWKTNPAVACGDPEFILETRPALFLWLTVPKEPAIDVKIHVDNSKRC